MKTYIFYSWFFLYFLIQLIYIFLAKKKLIIQIQKIKLKILLISKASKIQNFLLNYYIQAKDLPSILTSKIAFLFFLNIY